MITVNFSPQVDTAKMAGILQELKADPMGGWIELPKKVNAEEIARKDSDENTCARRVAVVSIWCVLELGGRIWGIEL